MAFQTHITYRGPLEKKVKGMGEAVKGAMVEEVRKWHQDLLPKHFTTQQQYGARYGTYTPRGRSYQLEKAKKYGHQNMLQYSGELKRNVTRGISITGSAKQVRGRLPGSQKANFRRTPSSPNVREEMLAVNQQEAQQMAQGVDRTVSKFLMSNDEVLTKTI